MLGLNQPVPQVDAQGRRDFSEARLITDSHHFEITRYKKVLGAPRNDGYG